MNTFIALLRGVNVGGKNRLQMAALRDTLTQIGFCNVQTYIQSGNVVFDSNLTDTAAMARDIQHAIFASNGFKPTVLVLARQETKDAMANNPFVSKNTDTKCIHFYFLSEAPSEASFNNATALTVNDEEYALIGKVFYLFAPQGVARSKLAGRVECILGVDATARNLCSVGNIMELAESHV